jgi:hypothetical protein
MRSRGPIAVLAVVGVACSFLLVGGPAARGKENVTARLLSRFRSMPHPGRSSPWCGPSVGSTSRAGTGRSTPSGCSSGC